MSRVALVIAASLAFAILGLVIGHLCLIQYHADIAKAAIASKTDGGPQPQMLTACYVLAPILGTVIGFAVSIGAFRMLAPSDEFHA